jgi:amidase
MTHSVRAPGSAELAAIAAEFGLDLDAEELASYTRLIAAACTAYARLDELPEPLPAVRYPRTPGWRPAPADNPYHAWYWRCDIAGAAGGVLAGKQVAVKDNIAVAGVPMMNGSRLLEGYVPEFDATVVTRVLDAGGRIAGKAACEDLCLSAGSHTCASGPIRNPHEPSRSAGGSSGGSAVLVATGAVDYALAGDQGGSIRTPAAWCGVYGPRPARCRSPTRSITSVPWRAARAASRRCCARSPVEIPSIRALRTPRPATISAR